MKRTPLRRRTPLRKRNARRATRLRERDFGAAAKIVRGQRCCVCAHKQREQPTPTEPHHEPPRSCGGTSRDLLPLCGSCHRARHRLGVETFWTHAGVEWRSVIERMRMIVADTEPGDGLVVNPFLGWLE